MAVSRVLTEDAIGASRAAAFDARGHVCALHMDLWSRRNTHARLGAVCEARLRAIAPKQGGGYLQLSGGAGEAFLRLPREHDITEGAALRVRIAAEERRDKLARAVIYEGEQAETSYFHRWLDALPGAETAQVERVSAGEPEIESAFDDALSPLASLPGGGTLHIATTPALSAIDVDTAGREASGRASRRAYHLNLEAARETARQLSLRHLGGLAVLDCTAPLDREAGKDIKAAFLGSWRARSSRKAEALPPSAFGLMQIKLEWGYTPLAHLLTDATGLPNGEAVALAGLRRLEREARGNRMDRLCLHLPDHAPNTAYDWFQTCGLNLQAAIDERFGARISIVRTNATTPDVTRL